MTHPFQLLPPGKGKYVFLPALALYLLVQIYFFFDNSLRSEKVPLGIVSFELARTVDDARAILNAWSESQRLHAAFSIGIDYAYIIGYANVIAFVCAWSNGILQERQWLGASIGVLSAWGAWMAGLLDMIENVALINMLFGNLTDPYPFIASTSATIKLILVIMGLVYSVYGGVGWLVDRWRERV